VRGMQNEKITKLARNLRKNLTPEEQKLWYLLRDRRFANYKFRRQFAIGSYIADFCCFKKKLIIELDGGQHNEMLHRQKDEQRDAVFKKLGYKVLRVWNDEINDNIDGVSETIILSLQD